MLCMQLKVAIRSDLWFLRKKLAMIGIALGKILLREIIGCSGAAIVWRALTVVNRVISFFSRNKKISKVCGTHADNLAKTKEQHWGQLIATGSKMSVQSVRKAHTVVCVNIAPDDGFEQYIDKSSSQPDILSNAHIQSYTIPSFEYSKKEFRIGILYRVDKQILSSCSSESVYLSTVILQF